MAIGTIGTGLDIPTLVAQLVAKEREPQENQINALGTAATSKLSAISTIKSGLSNLQTALAALVKSADNPGYKTTLGTDVTFTAAVDTGDNATSPVAGTHQVQVQQLAQNQKLSSKAFDKDAAIGGGKLTIGYGDTSLDVDIAADSKLADVAKAINKASGGKGVVASVVTADDGQHLVLTAVDSGEAGAITVTPSGGNGTLDDLAYDGTASSKMEVMVEAKDAIVIVDGFTRTSSSNTISDLVPGVTLTLTKANPDVKQTLTVGRDNSALKANLTAFVTAYNAINTQLKSATAYNSTTNTASA
ncbi:flagellar filament capping protein FliD, partial [Microbacterium sp. NPDC057467]